MSEEINKRESALSDAELESVSGALSSDEYHEISQRAESICKQCEIRIGRHCNGGSEGALTAYLREHGIDSVKTHRNCPYYRP